MSLFFGFSMILLWQPISTASPTDSDLNPGVESGTGVWLWSGVETYPFTVAMAVEVAQTETPTDTPTWTFTSPPPATFTPTLTETPFTPTLTETHFTATPTETRFTPTATLTEVPTTTPLPTSTPGIEQRVLFIAVSDRQYDPVAENVFETLLLANADATFLYLWRDGDAARLIAGTEFDQIWVFDLSDRTDGYTTDWAAIANWFRLVPGRNVICDARMIASYWEEPFKPDEPQRYQDEGRRLTQNYYENLKVRGGGLVLGTDDQDYQNGINSINQLIGLRPFSGLFVQDTVPIDTGNPLMTTPNNMGSQLFSDSTPGQAPAGLQPNSRIMYTAAWLANNPDRAAISSTIEGTVGFHVNIIAPPDGYIAQQGWPITFVAEAQNGTSPYSFSWSSSINGLLGAGQTLEVSTLSLGEHTITLAGFDGEGRFDLDRISVSIRQFVPTVTNTPSVTPTPSDTLTPSRTPTVTLTPSLTVTLTPTQTIGGLVIFSGSTILDQDLYVPESQNLGFAAGSKLAFLVPQSPGEFHYVAVTDGQGHVTDFAKVPLLAPGDAGQDLSRAQIIVDGGIRVLGSTPKVQFFPITPTPEPSPTPTSTPTCFIPAGVAVIGEPSVVPDLGIGEVSNLVPRGVDLDLDADIDLVLGATDGNLYVAFSTAGEIDLTAFSELQLGNGQSFSDFLEGDSAPAFADPDRDGDPDLFVADSTGRIFYSLNEGGSGGPVFASPKTVFSSTGIPVELEPRVIPEVVDINEDGVLDLVAGDINQHLLVLAGVHMEDATSPIIVRDATRLVFDEPVVWRDYSVAVPPPGTLSMYSLDQGEGGRVVGPGMLLGFNTGRLVLLEYTAPPDATQEFPSFLTRFLRSLTGECSIPNATGGPDASPAFLDIDGDGEGEFVVGNSVGNLITYENINIVSLMGYQSPAKGMPDVAKAEAIDLPPPFPPSPSETWGGFVFRERCNDRDSILRRARIFKAHVGVTMLNASPPIVESEFLECGEAGIRIEDNAFPTILDSLISRTNLVGIECFDFSSPTIRGTEIRESGQLAMRAADYSVPLMTNSRIEDNMEGILIENLAGPRLGDVPDLTLLEGVVVISNLRDDDDGGNVFRENRIYDIRNLTRGIIKAEGNFWDSADVAEIDSRIYDDDENSLLGLVDILPVGLLTPTYPPILPTPTSGPPGPLVTLTPTPTVRPAEELGDVVIRSATTWSGTIRLTGNVDVVNGVVVEIEPGTIIQAVGSLSDPPVIRFRSSTLRALGTEDEPIIFTSEIDQGWSGLAFEGRPPVESTVRYCEIHRSTRGLWIKDCSPQFEKVLISRPPVGCVVEEDQRDTRPVFRACTFWRCGASIRISGGAHPDLGTVGTLGAIFDPGNNVFFATAGLDIDVEQPTQYQPGGIRAEGNYYVQIVDATSEEGPIRRSQRITFPNLVTNPAQLIPFLPRVREVYVPELPAYQAKPVNVRPFGQTTSEGTIEDEQVWVGQVHITGDLNIMNRVTILPGTEIIVSTAAPRPLQISVFAATLYQTDGRVFEAVGTIHSLGTPALPVRFHADRMGPRQWEGIQFLGETSADTSDLLHTSILDTWVAVDCVVASPILRNCTLERFNDIGVNVTNVISPADEAGLAAAVSELRHADEIIDSEINNPFGVAHPMIRGCAILGDRRGMTGEIGIYSQTSNAHIEGTAIHFTKFAGVMVRGTQVPDLENGGNDFSFNFRTNFQNNSMLQIQAAANYWGIPGSFTGATEPPTYLVDETIIDDDENGNVGRVAFKPALDQRPSRILEFGDLNGDSVVDGEDLTDFMATWGSIIGQPQYRRRADFDRNRAVEKEDIMFFGIQWGESMK